MNPGFLQLQPYPFERLAQLLRGVTPNPELGPISLSIGEPQDPAPAFVLAALQQHQHEFSKYPLTRGIPELRQSVAAWLTARFALPKGSVDPERHVLPVNGTREALFAIAQVLIDRKPEGRVLMPNPFYQIYEGAALLAGATPYFVNCLPENDFQPDWDAVPESVWATCRLVYLCSPGNPTGAVTSVAAYRRILELADRFGFVIASDECYSEIYPDESNPPPGLLQACAEAGRMDFENCIVFHSLSKRSNLPGLRSGFVAGDATLMETFVRYRTYHGCAMPLPVQWASIAAWSDEEHVKVARVLYRARFGAVLPIVAEFMPAAAPDAAFYLWLETPGSDEEFALRLYRDQNVHVLPGSYLSREAHGQVPGRNRVRMCLVQPIEQCVEAAERIGRMLSAR